MKQTPVIETQPAHTPTPWRFKGSQESISRRGDVLGRPHPIDGGDYSPICTTSQDEDAAFIVKAVNAHEELVSMLEAIQVQLECPARNTNAGFKYRENVVISHDLREQVRTALAKLNA